MIYKSDCFAFKSQGNCKALIKMNCDECKFYKTKEQFIKERELYGGLKGRIGEKEGEKEEEKEEEYEE